MHPVVSYRGHFRYKQARGDAVPGYRHCIDGHHVARAKEKWVGILPDCRLATYAALHAILK